MERARIYMRSGSVIEVVADKFIIEHNSFRGELFRLGWEGQITPEVPYIHLPHVEAVVITSEREPGAKLENQEE